MSYRNIELVNSWGCDDTGCELDDVKPFDIRGSSCDEF